MDYDDGLVAVTADALVIRRYNLLLRTKTVPLGDIQAVERVALSRLTGRLRLWGTSTPSRWYNLDFGRWRKRVGFLFDTGEPLKPIVTPDDADRFAAALRDHGIGGA